MKPMMYQKGGMADYEVPKGKQAKLREQADAETTDRKMQEAAKRHQKTRVGGGKRSQPDPEELAKQLSRQATQSMEEGGEMHRKPSGKGYKKGGAVRGAGCAKRGVRKPKMY